MRNGRGLYESEVEVDFNMDQHNMQEDTILRQVLEDNWFQSKYTRYRYLLKSNETQLGQFWTFSFRYDIEAVLSKNIYVHWHPIPYSGFWYLPLPGESVF